MLNWSPKQVTGLYVHVPFCAHKCEYCAFYSHAPSQELVNRYVAALVRELELAAPRLQPGTIFFGGGTPSLLTMGQWERILETMAALKLTGASEWTVECNPATVSLDKARLLRSFGVNRISMGVQSLDEVLLDRLGRVHSREMVFKSWDILRSAGFANINLDLMFAIPGQTMETWRKTLRETAALQSEHLSCYEVIYEEDTPLYAQLNAGEFSLDEDLAADMYDELLKTASAAGYRQYEVANFARHKSIAFTETPDHACQHNVNYWRGGNYLGLGPSASSYVAGTRWSNIANTTVYCEKIENTGNAGDWKDELSALARAGETAAFGLRMNAGWPFELFRSTTGFDLRQDWAGEIDELVAGGFARTNPERFQLTDRGLRLADWVAEKFLRPEPARCARAAETV